MKKILIIGAGNLGFHLAKQLKNISELSLEVWNHQENLITQLLKVENFSVNVGITNFPTDANVYLICVKDNAIPEMAALLKNKISRKSVVLHTSGATDSNVLNIFDNYGVLYPLYSFVYTEYPIDWNKIPVFVVGNNDYAIQTATQLSQYLNGQTPFIINDTNKLYLHLMATMSNNFTNALMHSIYQISQQLPSDISKDKIYQSIIHFAVQTIQRAQNNNPAYLQTGPAIRFDSSTIQKHLDVIAQLQQNELKKIYLSFTEYIQNIIAHEINKK